MLSYTETPPPFWITSLESDLIIKLQSNIDHVLDKPVLIPGTDKPITFGSNLLKDSTTLWWIK